MPAAGWYEWQQLPSHKQPHFIHAPDSGLLAIAGLWAEWTAPDGQGITSCALLTKSAAPAIAEIHDRMPVILAPEQWDLWLSPWTAANDVQALIANARQDFEGHAISTRVNNVRNDDAGLLETV
ncbi:SOS response-associated peptidase [Pseudomonas resinovorans]|nr:SOS response-associated peptidase [Pseudomonas resinovorans]MDE3735534.1 SOS response-associated peptidase [Pseudomonas resinovorans]